MEQHSTSQTADVFNLSDEPFVKIVIRQTRNFIKNGKKTVLTNRIPRARGKFRPRKLTYFGLLFHAYTQYHVIHSRKKSLKYVSIFGAKNFCGSNLQSESLFLAPYTIQSFLQYSIKSSKFIQTV